MSILPESQCVRGVLILTLILLSIHALGPAAPPSSDSTYLRLSSISAAARSQNPAGSVKNTLILRNGTIVPGNYAPPNGIGRPDIPTSIVYASKHNRLYVTNGLSLATGNPSSNRVYVIDGASNGVMTELTLDGLADGLAYDPVHDLVYIAGGSKSLAISDATFQVVANITLAPGPPLAGVAYDSKDDRVYVSDYANSVVYSVDPTNKQVSRLPVAAGPTGIAYDADNDRLYVNSLNTISVIDGVINRVLANVTVSSFPPNRVRFPEAFQNIAYDSHNGDVYFVSIRGFVPNPRSPPASLIAIEIGEVLIFDPSTNQVAGSVGAGSWVSSVAYNPTDNKAYAASYVYGTGQEAAQALAVIDTVTNKVEANVTIPASPLGLAFDVQNNDLYVANARSDSVSVVDGATNSLVETFRLQNYPVGLAYDPDNHLLYVADEGSYQATAFKDSFSQTLLIVNPSTGAVQEVDTGGVGPSLIAYNVYNKDIYLTNQFSSDVTVVSGDTNKVVARVPVGLSPIGIVYNPSNHEIYVANQDSNTVSVIDSVSNTVVANLHEGNNPVALAYDSRDNLIFVTHTWLAGYTGGSTTFVTAMDGFTNSVVANITMGTQASALGIVYDPISNDVYVANWSANSVTLINGLTKTIVETIQLPSIKIQSPSIPQLMVPQFPEGLFYDPANNLVFVTGQLVSGLGNPLSTSVWVIDAETNKPVGTLATGYQPTGGAYDPDNGCVYLSNHGSGTLSIVSPCDPGDFNVEIAPASITFPVGSSAKASISLVARGFTGNVALSIRSTGPTASLDVSSVPLSETGPTKTATLTL